jgi:hypothetical protein
MIGVRYKSMKLGRFRIMELQKIKLKESQQVFFIAKNITPGKMVMKQSRWSDTPKLINFNIFSISSKKH